MVALFVDGSLDKAVIRSTATDAVPAGYHDTASRAAVVLDESRYITVRDNEEQRAQRRDEMMGMCVRHDMVGEPIRYTTG